LYLNERDDTRDFEIFNRIFHITYWIFKLFFEIGNFEDPLSKNEDKLKGCKTKPSNLRRFFRNLSIFTIIYPCFLYLNLTSFCVKWSPSTWIQIILSLQEFTVRVSTKSQ
jgi:hypothetical protein